MYSRGWWLSLHHSDWTSYPRQRPLRAPGTVNITLWDALFPLNRDKALHYGLLLCLKFSFLSPSTCLSIANPSGSGQWPWSLQNPPNSPRPTFSSHLITSHWSSLSPPGSSVHGILQARILAWVAVPFPRGSSWSRDWSQVSCTAGSFFTDWATSEAPETGQNGGDSYCYLLAGQPEISMVNSLKAFIFSSMS